MKKSDLIDKVALAHPHLYHIDAERIVNTIFDEISVSLAAGKRVELRGFGAFSVRKRDPRKARNPKTGEVLMTEEKFVPFFKGGRILKDRLNKK